MRRYPDNHPRGRQPCHVEACGRDATRDTPVCIHHWRAIPVEVRREFMGATRRVIAAAENTEEAP